MSLVNYAIYGSYKEIPQEEYYDWFKDASIIREESCVFSSFCGPHEFSTTISKNGMIYEYEDVPHQIYTQFRSAKSQGSFFNSQISKVFKYIKIS